MEDERVAEVKNESSSSAQDALGGAIASQPKGEHARKARGFVVTPDDIDILKFVFDFRLLTIEMVAELTGRTYSRLHKRLKGLVDIGHLKRRRRSFSSGHLYYIGKPGLGVLLERGEISEEDAERRRRDHELAPSTLEHHEMMIAKLHVMLALATRGSSVALSDWREGKWLRHTFEAPDGTEWTIEPDAAFQLINPEADRKGTYILEADRSSMSFLKREGSRRFEDKIERYRWFIQSGRAFETYGVQKHIRIVTVTLTTKRCDNLAAKTDRYLAENNLGEFRKYFLFAALPDFAKPASILEQRFVRPGDAQPRALI